MIARDRIGELCDHGENRRRDNRGGIARIGMLMPRRLGRDGRMLRAGDGAGGRHPRDGSGLHRASRDALRHGNDSSSNEVAL